MVVNNQLVMADISTNLNMLLKAITRAALVGLWVILRLGLLLLLLMLVLRGVIQAGGLRLVLMLVARQGDSLTIAPVW